MIETWDGAYSNQTIELVEAAFQNYKNFERHTLSISRGIPHSAHKMIWRKDPYRNTFRDGC